MAPPSRQAASLFVDIGQHTAEEWLLLAPEGDWKHPQYGSVKFTREKLERMLANWTGNVAQVQLAIDYYHGGATGESTRAAGWIEDLELRDSPRPGLWMRVRWTPTASQALADGEYRYVSPEWHDNWKDNTGKTHGPTLLGAGLTNRPFLRAEMGEHPVMAAAEGVYVGARERGSTGDVDENGKNGEAGKNGGAEEGTNMADETKTLAEVQTQLAAEKAEREKIAAELAETKKAREGDAQQLAELRTRQERADLVKRLSEARFGDGKRGFGTQVIERMADALMLVDASEARCFSEEGRKAGKADLTVRDELIALFASLPNAVLEGGERGQRLTARDEGKTAAEQLAELARKRMAEVTATGGKLAFADASVQVSAENPELVRRYRQETPKPGDQDTE